MRGCMTLCIRRCLKLIQYLKHCYEVSSSRITRTHGINDQNNQKPPPPPLKPSSCLQVFAKRAEGSSASIIGVLVTNHRNISADESFTRRNSSQVVVMLLEAVLDVRYMTAG